MSSPSGLNAEFNRLAGRKLTKNVLFLPTLPADQRLKLLIIIAHWLSLLSPLRSYRSMCRLFLPIFSGPKKKKPENNSSHESQADKQCPTNFCLFFLFFFYKHKTTTKETTAMY